MAIDTLVEDTRRPDTMTSEFIKQPEDLSYEPQVFAEQFLEEPVYEGPKGKVYAFKPSCTICTFRGIPLIDDAH